MIDTKVRAVLLALVVLVSPFVGLTVAQDSGADTDILNDAPTVDAINVPSGGASPGTAETYEFTITDNNGVNTIESVNIDLYRSDTTQGSSLSARKHYNITYDPDTQSATISPTTYSSNDDGSSNIQVTVVEDLDNGLTAGSTDTLILDIALADDTAPSQGVSGENSGTVNGYTWRVDTRAIDGQDATGSLTVDSEVNPLVNIALNASSIATSGQPDTNQTYDPALLTTNKGNVEVNIDYNATNQTSGSTQDKIQGKRLRLDNETYASADTAVQQALQYQETFQTFNTKTDYDGDETLSNFVDIPDGLDVATYSGKVYYSPQMSGAT